MAVLTAVLSVGWIESMDQSPMRGQDAWRIAMGQAHPSYAMSASGISCRQWAATHAFRPNGPAVFSCQHGYGRSSCGGG